MSNTILSPTSVCCTTLSRGDQEWNDQENFTDLENRHVYQNRLGKIGDCSKWSRPFIEFSASNKSLEYAFGSIERPCPLLVAC